MNTVIAVIEISCNLGGNEYSCQVPITRRSLAQTSPDPFFHLTTDHYHFLLLCVEFEFPSNFSFTTEQ